MLVGTTDRKQTIIMRVLIIGANGFVAGKLRKQLVRDGKIGNEPIDELILADVAKPPLLEREEEAVSSSSLASFAITTLAVDITDPNQVPALLQGGQKKCLPDIVFHLAAIVSGDAEQNFELGYEVNVDGTKHIVDAIRRKLKEQQQEGEGGGGGDTKPPRFVFTSSLAVFGPPMPETIGDDFHLTPRSSYGTQKAIVELMLEDYTRKGFLDAVAVRFPTIAVRPGKPNKAASSFFSSIIREPLNGVEATLPVGLDVRHAIASPRKAVEYLLKAATLEQSALQQRPGNRTFNVPSVSITVGEMIEALGRVTATHVGDRNNVVALIKHQPDPFIQRIVESWPKAFDCRKAMSLGFEPDASFEDIIRIYIEDELNNKSPQNKKQKTSEEA